MRDYLEAIGWNKQPPVPSLPDDVVSRTRDKYLEAYRRLTGRDTGVGLSSVSRPMQTFAMMRDDLLALVQQMIDRGIRFEDAQREFEKTFIARALTKTNYNVCKAAKMTGLHRNTLSRKIAEYKIKKSA